MAMYSRTEIAIRSIVTAKSLYEQGLFTEATVLAGSAQKIIRDICNYQGIEPAVKTMSVLRQSSVEQIIQIVHGAYNNLKHAERNTDKPVDVPDDEALFLIKLACIDLIRLKISDIRIQLLLDYVEGKVKD